MLANRRHSPSSARRAGIAWAVFAVLAAFYLWTEHRAHLFGALPYLVLLVCPLMHFFMHHGHHHELGDGTMQEGDDDRGGRQ